MLIFFMLIFKKLNGFESFHDRITFLFRFHDLYTKFKKIGTVNSRETFFVNLNLMADDFRFDRT